MTKQKVFTFNGELNFDTVHGLIERMEQSEEESKTLYFQTNGGEEAAAAVLARYISNGNIILECFGELSSAGINLYLNSKCLKFIGNNAWGVLHKGDCSLSLKEVKKQTQELLHHQEAIRRVDQEVLGFFDKELSAKEKKDYQGYEDVYVVAEQIHRAAEAKEKGKSNLVIL